MRVNNILFGSCLSFTTLRNCRQYIDATIFLIILSNKITPKNTIINFICCIYSPLILFVAALLKTFAFFVSYSCLEQQIIDFHPYSLFILIVAIRNSCALMFIISNRSSKYQIFYFSAALCIFLSRNDQFQKLIPINIEGFEVNS